MYTIIYTNIYGTFFTEGPYYDLDKALNESCRLGLEKNSIMLLLDLTTGKPYNFEENKYV